MMVPKATWPACRPPRTASIAAPRAPWLLDPGRPRPLRGASPSGASLAVPARVRGRPGAHASRRARPCLPASPPTRSRARPARALLRGGRWRAPPGPSGGTGAPTAAAVARAARRAAPPGHCLPSLASMSGRGAKAIATAPSSSIAPGGVPARSVPIGRWPPWLRGCQPIPRAPESPGTKQTPLPPAGGREHQRPPRAPLDGSWLPPGASALPEGCSAPQGAMAPRNPVTPNEPLPSAESALPVPRAPPATTASAQQQLAPQRARRVAAYAQGRAFHPPGGPFLG